MGKLPKQEKEAKAMKWMAIFYTIMAGKLCHRGYSEPLLKCVRGDHTQAIIEEMHEGICQNHARSRALIAQILRTGYF